MRRPRTDRRFRRPITAALVTLVLAGACGDGSTQAVGGVEPPPTEAEAVERAVGAERPVATDGDADPAGDLVMEDVVAAALLIASGGDLEAAIAAGLVGEIEAEAALDALERGSLDGILGGTGGVD